MAYWGPHRSAPPKIASDVVSRDGQSFDTVYTLREKLGDGGTAQVWAAVHQETGELAACKLAARGEQSVGRRWARAIRTFEHEAAMLERCQHEHIVRLLGTFQGPRDLVLALEFVPGGDIQMLLQRHGALAEPAVGAIIRQLSLALQHVHSLKLLHRDVKLENLVVVRPGSAPVIKLCDFGHSASMFDCDDGFTGTVGYSAPEVSGQDGRTPMWTPQADVWSTGVVMYAMSANSPLRMGRDGPDFGSRLLLGLSTQAKLLIKALLAPNRDERASLEHAAEVLTKKEEQRKTTSPRGMRRGLSSAARSYSLLDISALDKESVPRAAVVVPTSTNVTPMVSTTASRENTSSSAYTTSRENSATASATASAAATRESTRTPPNGDATRAAVASSVAERLRGVAEGSAASADDGLGVECERAAWWAGGRLVRQRLHVDESTRRVLSIDSRSGKVTEEWRFDQIVAILEDDENRQRTPSTQRRASRDETDGDQPDWRTSPAGPDLRARRVSRDARASRDRDVKVTFSLLVEGAGALAFLCLGSCGLVQRQRFTLRLEERNLLLASLRNALRAAGSMCAGIGVAPTPTPLLSRHGSRASLIAAQQQPPPQQISIAGAAAAASGAPGGGGAPGGALMPFGRGLQHRGMSCGHLNFLDQHSLSAQPAPSAQEEQLKRMRDRFAAIRAANRLPPPPGSPLRSEASSPDVSTGRATPTPPEQAPAAGWTRN